MDRRAIFLSVACAALGVTAGLCATPAPKMIVTPLDAVVFKPLNPASPAGPQFAVLRGDPESGPSTMLMKFGRGDGRMHVHSSDYDLVVIKGDMKHWAPGETEAAAKLVGPGGYWFQPGNQPHVDSCESEECLMYVQWSGKRDSRAFDNNGTN